MLTMRAAWGASGHLLRAHLCPNTPGARKQPHPGAAHWSQQLGPERPLCEAGGQGRSRGCAQAGAEGWRTPGWGLTKDSHGCDSGPFFPHGASVPALCPSACRTPPARIGKGLGCTAASRPHSQSTVGGESWSSSGYTGTEAGVARGVVGTGVRQTMRTEVEMATLL